MNKKGISLIVLVITIIVMIILAASVVITLSSTGVINQANTAVDATNSKEVEHLATLAWAEAYTAGERTKEELEKAVIEKLKKNNINTEDYILNVNEKGVSIEKKVAIVAGQGFAADFTDGKEYGTTVEYNSNVSGMTWKLLHSDGTNIYLIAADYPEKSTLPLLDEEGGATSASDSNNYRARFTTATTAAYKNSDAVSEIGKKLNAKYFAKQTTANANENIRAAAYMLDTDKWNAAYGNGEDAEKTKYVIGGPTIELLLESCNAKNNTAFVCDAPSTVGYQLKDSASNAELALGVIVFDPSDDLYILPTSKTIDGTSVNTAEAYWLASPSDGGTNGMMYVYCDGGLSMCSYGESYVGFRPVICLEYDAQLEKVGNVLKIK